jgi:predicted TIM-barrel fold metal-dependent hydrolase
MEIFANHAHVMPSKGGELKDLIALMGECEISKAVTFAPFPQDVENPNEWLKKQIAGDSRFVGFGTVDFNAGNFKDQVERIADYGFRGIKLHPAHQRFAIMCPEAQEVYAAAEERGLVLSFHTGIHWHRIRDYDVKLFDEVAYNFKNLRFSMEHVGGYAYFYEAIGVLCNNWHLFAGFTSVFDWEMNKYWYLNEKQLHDTVHLIGASRCIFGLDFPYNDVQKTKIGIDFIKNMQISEEEKALILGGALKLFLGER